MKKFTCDNCRYSFAAEEAGTCPRCSSRRLSVVGVEKIGPVAKAGVHTPQKFLDGKDGWRAYHTNEMRNCPQCGGTELTYDRVQNEKTCTKCGTVTKVSRVR